MCLPLLDLFSCPYEIWSKRIPTQEERNINQYSIWELVDGVDDKLEKTICSPFEAAQHILDKGVDNLLAGFIEDKLKKSTVFRGWRRKMPYKIPKNIKKYQNSYPKCNFSDIDDEINNCGCLPSEGQYFFHGGLLFGEGMLGFNTSRPLSTTLCPQVALREAEFKGKGYDRGEIHIYVLKVINPRTKVYVFRNNDSNMGHEKEVLFGSGANLHFVNKTLISDSYKVGKHGLPSKKVSAYVVEITIS